MSPRTAHPRVEDILPQSKPSPLSEFCPPPSPHVYAQYSSHIHVHQLRRAEPQVMMDNYNEVYEFVLATGTQLVVLKTRRDLLEESTKNIIR